MKLRLLGAVCACAFSLSANAAVVLFDTTEIVFSASGSANTIAGSWNARSMTIPIGADISFFNLEVTALSVSDGHSNPRSIKLSAPFNPNPYGSISIDSNPPFSVYTVNVGATANIPNSPHDSEWKLLTHMVQGYNSPLITHGPVIMSWPSGGFDVNAMGVLSVEAYGEAVVPIPPAVWLFGSGLLGLVGVARRKATLAGS